MRRLERDHELIDCILEDAQALARRLVVLGVDRERFCSDRSETGEIAYDAVMSPVYRIAEDAMHLSDDVRDACPGYPWDDIRGFRNFVAHGYRQVDRAMAWGVVERDIPELARILSEYKETHPL